MMKIKLKKKIRHTKKEQKLNKTKDKIKVGGNFRNNNNNVSDL